MVEDPVRLHTNRTVGFFFPTAVVITYKSCTSQCFLRANSSDANEQGLSLRAVGAKRDRAPGGSSQRLSYQEAAHRPSCHATARVDSGAVDRAALFYSHAREDNVHP